MKKNAFRPLVIIFTLFLLYSCHTDKIESVSCSEDPQPLGLQPNAAFSNIQLQSNRFGEYDSLFLSYNIQVEASAFSDSMHTNIKVKGLRNKNGYIDTNQNELILEGCHVGDSRDFREILLSSNAEIYSTITKDDTTLMREIGRQLLDSIESRLYYFDEIDWRYFRVGYLRGGFCTNLHGEVNVVLIKNN